MLDEINQEIEDIKAAGLIDLHYQDTIDRQMLKPDTFKEPKVLGLQKLAGCFFILFVGLLLSLFVFVIEILIQILKKIKFVQNMAS